MKPMLKSNFTLPALALIAAANLCALPVLAQTTEARVANKNTDHARHWKKPVTTLNLAETSEIKSAPDVAYITFGVQTEAKTADEALRANAQSANAVFAALKQQGIAEKNIQTSNLNLHPVYNYPSNSSGDSTPVLRGYQVSNQVSVRVDNVARLGPVIDAVVKSGVNQINSVSFGLSDPSTAEDQARREATKTLQARAELYAQSLGLKVKRIVVLSETAAFAAPAPIAYRKAALQAASADATPIAGGEVSTSITLNAVFELGE